MVLAVGKLRESMIQSSPPCPGTGSEGCWKVWYTYELFPTSAPSGPVTFSVLTVELKMYGFGDGTESKVDSFRPKFLARTDFGV
jgi:hypothetical protein